MTIQAGTIIGGKYEILKCLGAGGMGAVYLAQDRRQLEFKVALKVLYPGVIKSAEAKERFRYEINAAYRVDHVNVVRAYEFFEEGDLFAYAMELVDGEDLLSRIQRGNISVAETTTVLRQVAMGLHAIHCQGIVHRDLKPENILISHNGVAKISDFGVARLTGGYNVTESGSMVGTPKYVAPEYVQTGLCDHRGDIYALGVIGYECIAGEAPFESESKRDLILERFHVRGLKLKEVVPDCPDSFVDIIDRAMMIDARSRYQTALEMVEDLDRFGRGEPLRTSPGRRKRRASEAPSFLMSKGDYPRSRVAILAVVAFIMIAAGAGVTMLLLPKDGSTFGMNEQLAQATEEFNAKKREITQVTAELRELLPLVSPEEAAPVEEVLRSRVQPFLSRPPLVDTQSLDSQLQLVHLYTKEATEILSALHQVQN